MKIQIGFALFWLIAVGAPAADVFQVSFEPRLKYTELSTSCEFAPMASIFFLSVEWENGRVTQGRLKKGFYGGPKQTLALSAEEIAGLDIVEVPEDQSFWIKNWTVGDRILPFLFNGGKDSGFGSCYPPPLATIEPSQFTFSYNVAHPPGPYSLKSNKGVFKGNTQKGQVYRITLTLDQQQE